MNLTTIPRGTMFVRSILARAASGDAGDAGEYARSHYGDRAAHLAKAAVSAGSIGSGDWGAVLATPEQAEFFALVQQASIVGRLGLRTVALRVRTQTVTAGATAYWVSAGAPKPVTKQSVLGDTLTALKVAGLFVGTKEFFRNTSSATEQRFREDLIRAEAEELDRAFIDPSNAGSPDEMPVSVTNGVTPITSTGSPAGDIAALIAAFTGDLSVAVFVTDPVTAAEIALARDAAGGFLFPNCGPRGGSLLGIPLLVSRSSPRDSAGGQLALIDGSGIAYGAEGVRNATSEVASLAMRDDPSMPAEMVSLFQIDSIAILCEMSVNWKVQREGSVALVAGATYPVGVVS